MHARQSSCDIDLSQTTTVVEKCIYATVINGPRQKTPHIIYPSRYEHGFCKDGKLKQQRSNLYNESSSRNNKKEP